MSLKPPSERPPDELDFFLKSLKNSKVMTREEEVLLARKTRSSDPKEAEGAKQEFLNRNMKLLVKIARGFKSEDLSLSDMVQEGSIGLMRALEKFDPDRGFKFSTYASWWIRQAITRALHNSGGIRIPPYLVSARWRLTRLEKNLTFSDEEAANLMAMSEKHIRVLRGLPALVFCFDNPVSSEGETTFGEMVPEENPSHEEMDRNIQIGEMRAQFDKFFATIPPRDVDIIFRWARGEESLEEIGKSYAISRERVRQIILAHIGNMKKKYRR